MISFIILNYKNFSDTLNCINSIDKIKDDKTNILVVDNNSLSKQELKILQNKKIDILRLDKNYGYAKANNKGIDYIKGKCDSDFYVVINNDIIINQSNFLDIIRRDYEKYKFDMMGPKINSTSGESINPFPVIKTKDDIQKEIKRCKLMIKIYNNCFLYFLLNLYINIKHFFIKIEKKENGKNILKKVALHGCAIIFSKKYVKKYEYPFYNETFLYHEEEFLYHRIINDNLISLYDPKLEVFHKEGSSIKKENKKERIRKLFREEERLKSLMLLLEIEGE